MGQVPELQFRPLTTPPATPAQDRVSSSFTRSWPQARQLLLAEAAHLDATLVVVEVEVDPSGIRADHQLRAGAKVGDAVAVSFDSKHGPLRYECSTFVGYWRYMSGWQANTYAIALALDALRRVDRYGVGTSGEQYRGWTAISGPTPSGFLSADDALRFLRRWQRPDETDVSIDTLYRRAVRTTHPDSGGSHDQFLELQAAYQLVRGSI